MAYVRFGGTAADVSVKETGAPYAGDTLTVWDEVRSFGSAAMTYGDATLTAAGGAFVAGDVGRLIVVEGAGASGGLLRTTVASVTSGTEVELATAAGMTVTAAIVGVYDPVTDLLTWDGGTAQTSVTSDSYGRVRFQAPDTYATLWVDSGSGAMVAVKRTTAGSGTVTSVTAGNGTITVAGTASAPTVAATVGTTSGTVAAGDDSRITGAVPKSTVTAKGSLIVASGSGAVAELAVGTNDYVLTADSAATNGVKWAEAAAGGGAVDSVNGQTGTVVLDSDDIDDSGKTHQFATAAQLSKLDGIESGADVTDAANVASAGAVMATTVNAKGDLLVASADDTVTRLAVGTNDYVLTADSAQATGVKWAAATSGIAATIFDAKGDLIAASAADTAARLAVGADGTALVADSAQATGLKWQAGYLIGYKPPVGKYQLPPYPSMNAGNDQPGNGVLRLCTWLVPVPTTYDRIGIRVKTAGGTGAVIRLGIWADSQGPGTLILDAGTVDATGTGWKEITISQALPAGAYWLGAVVQGNPSPVPYLYYLRSSWFPWADTDDEYSPTSALTVSSVTGALGSSPTHNITNNAPSIRMRVSA